MKLFYAPHILTDSELPAEEAVHAVKVLRLKPGDELTIVDGVGNFHDARVAHTDGRQRCRVELIATRPQAPQWEGHRHIALAPTKNADRMEWLVEKATEIGVDEVSFLDCRYSERKAMKTDRLQRVAISAIKQSLKARLPQLNAMTDFRAFVSQPRSGGKFIAPCHEGEKPLLQDCLTDGGDATILIGPEGDFSTEEVELAVQCGYIPVSLGKSRLRTETAALVACTILSLHG